MLEALRWKYTDFKQLLDAEREGQLTSLVLFCGLDIHHIDAWGKVWNKTTVFRASKCLIKASWSMYTIIQKLRLIGMGKFPIWQSQLQFPKNKARLSCKLFVTLAYAIHSPWETLLYEKLPPCVKKKRIHDLAQWDHKTSTVKRATWSKQTEVHQETV